MYAILKVPKNTMASILGNQEADGNSDRAPKFLCGDRRTFQKHNHICSTPPIRHLW
jgi:hypothetical protein